MAREDLHFRLRIPESLKARVEQAALENRRSMTAEIIARLEESFEQHLINEDLETRLDAVEERVWDIIYTLGDSLKHRPS